MSAENVLELNNVTVRLGQRTVLSKINIDVRAGEFVGVIGPNGAGKTTLLRVILRLLSPSTGQVTVAGNVGRLGNRMVGYVPQKIHLDPDTPMRGRDLVGLGIDGHRWGIPWPSPSRSQRIEEVLHAVDALRFADSPVGRLSGGEQQRLLIAQALLSDPKILLLDEPLSNLDIRSAHEVVRLVSRIAKEKNIAVLLVAHDMNPLLEVMDRVLYLAQGRAVMGKMEDVIRTDVLSDLYGYHVEVLRVRDRVLIVGGIGSEADVVDLAGGSHCDDRSVMSL